MTSPHVLKIPCENPKFIEKIMGKGEVLFFVRYFGFGKIVDFHKDSVLRVT